MVDIKTLLCQQFAVSEVDYEKALAYQVKYIGAMGNTHCALAPGAMEPLQSALKYFRDDFDRHISGGCCPYESHKVHQHQHQQIGTGA